MLEQCRALLFILAESEELLELVDDEQQLALIGRQDAFDGADEAALVASLISGDIYWLVREQVDGFALYPAYALVPLAMLAQKAAGNLRGRNMVALGALAALFHLDRDGFTKSIKSRYAKKKQIEFLKQVRQYVCMSRRVT